MAVTKKFTVEEKKRSNRFLEHMDKVERQHCPGLFGVVLANYDHWVWVRWDNAGKTKGCWKPDTEDHNDVIYVGDYEE